MECEPKELQFLGAAGIYTAAASIPRGPHRPLFARVAAAFVLPLSALFLFHIAISHALFKLRHRARLLPGTDAQRRLLSRLASDWLALLLFKVEPPRWREGAGPPRRQSFSATGGAGFPRRLCGGLGGAAPMVAPLLGDGRGRIY